MRLLAPALLLAGIAIILPTSLAQEDPTVDLRLRIDFQDPEAHAGDMGFFGFNVTNLGEATATNVTVVLMMPEGVTFLDGHQCESEDGTIAVCSGEDLPSGAMLGYSFHVRFEEEGEKTITGVVSSDQPDANPADNAAEKTVVVGEPRPNPPVDNITCVAEQDSIRVSWGVNDFVIEYRVYRAEGDGEFSLVWSGVADDFVDADVTAGTTYSYYVTALRSHGESEPGTICEVTAIPEFPSWAFAAAAGVVAVAGYAVLRRRG